jgi:hypothetical protein
MTTEVKPTQEQAEQYCELIAALLDNPLTDRDSRLSDAALETAQDLLLELNRDAMADALRFNKAQLVAIILNSKPDDQTEAAAPDSHRFYNALQLGEHLAAFIENPETPADMQNYLADAASDLLDDASATIAGKVREKWTSIAMKLVADESSQEGVTADES